MNMDYNEKRLRRKILLTFITTSLIGGSVFASLVSRPTLQQIWFHYHEYWLLPTKKLSILACVLFFSSLATAFVIAQGKNWFSFSKFRLVIGAVTIAAAPFIAWLVEPASLLLQFFLFRMVLVLLLTVTLFVVTQRWFWVLAGLMFLTAAMIPLLGALPYTVFASVTPEWFEISEFVFGSVVLATLCALWLTNSQRPIVRS